MVIDDFEFIFGQYTPWFKWLVTSHEVSRPTSPIDTIQGVYTVSVQEGLCLSFLEIPHEPTQTSQDDDRDSIYSHYTVLGTLKRECHHLKNILEIANLSISGDANFVT